MEFVELPVFSEVLIISRSAKNRKKKKIYLAPDKYLHRENC